MSAAAATLLARPRCPGDSVSNSAGNRICNVCRRFYDVCAREHMASPNTLQLAADLQFFLDEEQNAQSGEEHQRLREKIRMARAEVSSALLVDLKKPIASLLAARRNAET
jgi:hypothetical protein